MHDGSTLSKPSKVSPTSEAKGLGGDRPARRECQQPRTAPSANRAVHFVAVEQGRATAPPGGEPFRRHRHDAVEVAARERRVRRRSSHELEQFSFSVLAAGALGNYLLRQHVERRILVNDRDELAAPECTEQRRALDQVVASHR